MYAELFALNSRGCCADQLAELKELAGGKSFERRSCRADDILNLLSAFACLRLHSSQPPLM